MPERIAIITGSRSAHRARHAQAVAEPLGAFRPTWVWHGSNGAGIDEIANHWASLNGVRCERFGARWQLYGDAAGPVRNGIMCHAGAHRRDVFGDIVVCLAFPGPKSKGTWDCKNKAEACGLQTFVIEVDW